MRGHHLADIGTAGDEIHHARGNTGFFEVP